MESGTTTPTQSDSPRMPTLRRLCAGWLLQHAHEFDLESQGHISHVLILVPSVTCSALRAPDAFAGAAALPGVVDCCRVVLSNRSRQGNQLLEELYRAVTTEPHERPAQWWQDVEAVASRLLTTGMLKRDVRGPLLTQQLSNHVRRIRKLAQTRSGDGQHASELRFARAFPQSKRVISLEACRRAYFLKHLEAHTG